MFARSRLLALSALGSLLFLAAGIAACGEEEGNGGRVRVVTSLELFADFVRHVGGERVKVTALVPGDADPHTYEPVPSQVVEVAQADVVIINGLGLEEALHNLIENNVASDVPVIEIAEGLPVIAGGDEGEGHTDEAHARGNPHLWLDVQNAIRYVEKIRDALVEVDPQSADVYRANAQRYLDELAALDEEIVAATESIPVERRKLVTFHNVFPYFAKRYGFQVVGVVVEAPGREPSPEELGQLSDRIRSEGVPVVFSEPQFAGTVLEAVARDAGVEVRMLLSDSFAGKVGSYVEMMHFNVQEILRLGE